MGSERLVEKLRDHTVMVIKDIGVHSSANEHEQQCAGNTRHFPLLFLRYGGLCISA